MRIFFPDFCFSAEGRHRVAQTSGCMFPHLHLSVPVLVGVTTALALPAEFLQLGLAALDGFRL